MAERHSATTCSRAVAEGVCVGLFEKANSDLFGLPFCSLSLFPRQHVARTVHVHEIHGLRCLPRCNVRQPTLLPITGTRRTSHAERKEKSPSGLQVQAVHSELIGGDAEPPTARGLARRGRVKGLVGGR